jgi:hypothetical protein
MRTGTTHPPRRIRRSCVLRQDYCSGADTLPDRRRRPRPRIDRRSADRQRQATTVDPAEPHRCGIGRKGPVALRPVRRCGRKRLHPRPRCRRHERTGHHGTDRVFGDRPIESDPQPGCHLLKNGVSALFPIEERRSLTYHYRHLTSRLQSWPIKAGK